MKQTILKLLVLLVLQGTPSRAMMMRNNALINKMVSHFQGKSSDVSIEAGRDRQPGQGRRNVQVSENPKNVLSLMQNVLCRNFPSIPCNLIVQDETLKKLIEKSIQQIKYKRYSLEKTTPPSGTHLTLFPLINSEDLSNFLQASDTGHHKEKRKQIKSVAKSTSSRENENRKQNKKESKVIPVYNGRKKIRRFYPHKIKYKDKPVKTFRRNFAEYSDEKLSMSVEQPEGSFPKKMTFQPEEHSVWRIDYMKHGEPSFNIFQYDSDRLKEKRKVTNINGQIVNSLNKTVETVVYSNHLQHIKYECKLYYPKCKVGIVLQRQQILYDCLALQISTTVSMSRPVLSTHVLDISTGVPAIGMFVELYKKKDNSWTLWHNTVTSGDGRIQFPFSKDSMAEGTYKLKFNIGDYYSRTNTETLYPFVEISFCTKEGQHYHIPLLLSPYGYSTYRGS